MNYGNAFEKLKKLDESGYKKLYKTLLSYASYRLRFYKNKPEVPEYFVSEAIRKAIDDTSEDHRRWNIDATPDFEDFLKSCISSEISNYFSKKGNKPNVDVDENADFDLFENLGNTNPENLLIDKEFQDFLFDELVEQEEELAELLFFENEGYEMDEIIKKLGYDNRDDVYNARKRLRRAVKKILEKYNEQ